MGKRYRREKKQRVKYYEDDDEQEHLSPETKRGIIVILLICGAVIALLALFGLAGELGQYLSQGLSLVFGWTRWIFPFMLLLLSYFLLKQQTGSTLSTVRGGGMLLAFVSLNGLFHVWRIPSGYVWMSNDLMAAGGYVGVILGAPLLTLMGKTASVILLLAFFCVSLLIITNASFNALLMRISAWIFWLPKILKERFVAQEERFEDVYDETVEDREEEFPDEGFASDLEKELDQGEADVLFQKKILGDEDVLSPSKRMVLLAKKKSRAKIDLPLTFLDNKQSKPMSGDTKVISGKIKKAFQNFGIDVEMGEMHIGPTVTQYTMKPAEGVKLSRVRALNDDLALALAAHPIRIEAPIPGKPLVGIEVPNQSAALVTLREILESKEFSERTSQLAIALGKDVSGKPWVADLASMPHLLIAGATGSGKTVCINAIVTSLLYQNSPDDLKFIMIDPKRVELPLYNGIPHLLTPVITDVKKTIHSLKWCLLEMDRRFELFSRVRKRDIATYNSSASEKIPYLIVIIDELADLMSLASQEVEAAVIRLSQMARAVGIHLVLATQRPSVDVITGLIKANITSRIAFAVASLMDSRTILDSSGAEKLLGRGDMLFISATLSKPKRLQGVFASDEDIRRIVNYLQEKYDEPEYNASVVDVDEEIFVSGTSLDDLSDELYEEAKEVVLQMGRASASLLQRRLKIGYARAARLMDILEEQGVVGHADGAKPRTILVDQFSQDVNMEDDLLDKQEKEF